MTYDLVSLSIIMMIAVACPIITQLIPGKPMPQTVLLLVFGAIFGPFILDKIWVTKAVELLSELGLAFLFLLDVVWARSRPASSCDSSRRTATIH